MVEAIIFDADHTLYTPKTEQAYEKTFSYLAGELGLQQDRLREIFEQEVNKATDSDDPTDRHRHTVMKQTLLNTELPVEDRNRMAQQAVDRFWDQVIADIEYNRELPMMLERIHDRGIELLGIASDEFRDPLERKLNTVLGDWEQYFSVLITPENTDTMKPSPSFFEQLLHKEQYPPEAVMMVGDSWERDLAPAAEIGMTTVLVADQKHGNPDYFINDIMNLEAIIERL
ncbi:MAG: HAD family hydrolase [Candidatus Nanohaloarchaeota archaeon QJJ-5]|nr:HAD family hydrolase [Candidatus Nanohaloarchaeota archaeon QJJ-5]